MNPQHVRFYVCGPTVYDRAHIGNARPVVVFDMLFRLLQQLYPQVTYVRNITDIEDKIIWASQEKNISIAEITTQNTLFYNEDMGALGALPPTHTPKATEHIPQMLHIISLLIDQGHAYAAEGHVLFNVKSDPRYGALSKLPTEDRLAGARVDVAPYKKDPEDFVLWKPSNAEQPGWESPWGRGRPGWHIECSAMAEAYLGTPFDIHGGGIDLIFPHHENEIAQTCCAYNTDTMAQVWMHNGHLIVNGEKMSKSLGNFFTVADLLDEMPGEVIRLTLLSAHYRQPLNWTPGLVLQMKNILDKFYTALQDFHGTPDDSLQNSDFFAALLDDLNTPLALTHLHTLVKEIHTCHDPAAKQNLQSQLKTMGNFLGILSHSPAQWFQRSKDETQLITPEEIENSVQNRAQAKGQKDYKKADDIRKFLEENGVLLEDTPTGTTWKYR